MPSTRNNQPHPLVSGQRQEVNDFMAVIGDAIERLIEQRREIAEDTDRKLQKAYGSPPRARSASAND